MSAHRQPFKNTDEIQVGFLSARATEVLSHVLSESTLSDSEKQTLDEAEQFLQRIAEGASIATTGLVRQGVSPSRSIAAFDMALGPMDALRQLLSVDDQLDTFFSDLARAIHAVRNEQKMPIEKVQNARSFFIGLQKWISAELSTRRMAMPFGEVRFA